MTAAPAREAHDVSVWDTGFEAALRDARHLLHDLPRTRDAIVDARERLNRWRAEHPGVRAELVADQPPGSLFVDYDLILDDPTGGTLAVTWRPDDGVPWLVNYAEHWASNLVASIDGEGITVQDAFRALHLAGDANPDLLELLVEQQLVVRAVEREQLAPEPIELQAAADDFRRAHGLHSASAMHDWLQSPRLTLERFQRILTVTLQARKLRQRIASERIDEYFARHRADFDRLQFVEVRTARAESARQLTSLAATTSLMSALECVVAEPDGHDVRAELRSQFARDVSPVLRSAGPGQVMGPEWATPDHVLVQLLTLQPAQLDQRSAAIEELVYREWLAEQRAAAAVEWHWV